MTRKKKGEVVSKDIYIFTVAHHTIGYLKMGAPCMLCGKIRTVGTKSEQAVHSRSLPPPKKV